MALGDLQPLLDNYRQTIAGPLRGRIEQRLQQAAPVGETGNTKRNTRVRLVANNRNEIRLAAEVNVDYAQFPEEGTRAHTIVPRRAQALSFYWPKLGRRVFLARVNHPGNPARPWFHPTLARFAEFIREVAA